MTSNEPGFGRDRHHLPPEGSALPPRAHTDPAVERLLATLASRSLANQLAFAVQSGVLDRLVQDREFVDPGMTLVSVRSELAGLNLPRNSTMCLFLSDVSVRVAGWCRQQGYGALSDSYLRRAGELLRYVQEECTAELQQDPMLRAQCATSEAQVLCYLGAPERANPLVAELLRSLSLQKDLSLPQQGEPFRRAELEARFGLCAISDACGETGAMNSLFGQIESTIIADWGRQSREWLRFLRLRGHRALRLGAHESRHQPTAEADRLFNEAERDFNDAQRLTSIHAPGDAVAYAAASSDLTAVYLVQERFDDAERLAAEAYRLVTEARGGQVGPICAPFAYNLMKAYEGLGRAEEASILSTLIARWEAPPSPDDRQ